MSQSRAPAPVCEGDDTILTTILFDLDGTLIPYTQEAFIRAYFKLLLRRLGPMGYDGEKLTDALWQGMAAMVKNDGRSTNRQIFWEEFTRLLGIGALSLESIFEDFYTRDFDAARSALAEPADRSGLLRSLREKGFALLLATNPVFPLCAVETRLHWVGLSAADFDYVTTYENSRRCKPDPQYYRDLLEQTGRKAGECLMVGNDPVEDMSALDAGLAVCLVTDYLENPNNVPLDPFPRSSFRELERSLEHLRPLEQS